MTLLLGIRDRLTVDRAAVAMLLLLVVVMAVLFNKAKSLLPTHCSSGHVQLTPSSIIYSAESCVSIIVM